MATTASDIQAQAAIDAWLNSQAVKDMQNNINSAYEAGVTQAGLSNEQMMNTLNQYITDYNNQYQKDAKSAYINKMQGEQLVSNELARLGLTNSGWGVSQKLQNNSVYSQNLSGLKDALSQKLTKVDMDKANQQLEYEKTLQQLLATKNEQQYSYNQYLANMSEQIRQQEISNYLEQQYNNTIASQSSGVSLGGTELNGTSIEDILQNISGNTNTTDNLGNSSKIINASDYLFKDTDQPRYVYDNKLQNTNKTAGDLGVTTNGVGKGYRIWQGVDDKGNTAYYVWNNNIKTYLDVTGEYNNKYNKNWLQKLLDGIWFV